MTQRAGDHTGYIVGVGNGLILGYLMYRYGLVPRGMAMLGLVGGPLLSLGIYLMVKGFKPSPILSGTIGGA